MRHFNFEDVMFFFFSFLVLFVRVLFCFMRSTFVSFVLYKFRTRTG